MSDKLVHVSEIRTFLPLSAHAQAFDVLSVAKVSARMVRDDANVVPVETLARLWNRVASFDDEQAVLAAFYVAYFEGNRFDVYGRWGDLMRVAPSMWHRLEVGRRTLAAHTDAPDWVLGWLPRPRPQWRFSRHWGYDLATPQGQALAAICELAEWLLVLQEGGRGALGSVVVELPDGIQHHVGARGLEVASVCFDAVARGRSPCKLAGGGLVALTEPTNEPGRQARLVLGAEPALVLDAGDCQRGAPSTSDPELFSALEHELAGVPISRPVADLAALVAAHPGDDLRTLAARAGLNFRTVSALSQQLGGLRWIRERSQVELAIHLRRRGWSRSSIAANFGMSSRALSRQVLTWSGAHFADFGKGESESRAD